MRVEFEVALIEPADEIPPKRSIKQAIEVGERLELPIAQPTKPQLLWGMALLIVLATLFFGLLYWALSQQKSPISLETKLLLFFCWLIAVVGPALFWFVLPSGILKSDHWLRYDRQSSQLSIRGGYSILNHDEIVCIISISDLRRKKQPSELQVISIGPNKPYLHLVLNSRELDPRQAFGSILQQFSDFARIPKYYATIDEDGDVSISED